MLHHEPRLRPGFFWPANLPRHPLRWLLPVALLALAACDKSRLPFDDDAVVGKVRSVRVEEPARPIDLARRYGVGLAELERVNATVGGIASGIIPAGTRLIMPTRFVLPEAARRGIVVNVAELRLYIFPEDNKARGVLTFPAAIGRDDWETPTGETAVVERIVDPPWFPPASIREEAAAKGQELPVMVPPGPDNPLGKYALRLGWRKHMIHGTNNPMSIGKPVTHGCIRLYPEDMKTLFEYAHTGTPVVLVDQPYKLGATDGVLYLETHRANGNGAAERRRVLANIQAWLEADDDRRVDEARVQQALRVPTEMPIRISF
jgi:L,D-transpeptidase ErfK/SrfK